MMKQHSFEMVSLVLQQIILGSGKGKIETQKKKRVRN
jgi:hypothetical protein